MKVKALRSFLVEVKEDGTRDEIQAGEIRDMETKQFKELQVHGLSEATPDEVKAYEAAQKDAKKK